MSVTVGLPDAGLVGLGRRGDGAPFAGEEGYRSSRWTPERSLQQRIDALAWANEVRSRRSRLKRDLAGGRVCVLDVLEDVPEWAETMKVMDLLLAMPRVGRVKAGKLLKRTDMSPSKTLGGMSPRQRQAIIERLGVIPCKR